MASMNAPMPALILHEMILHEMILHDGQAVDRRARRGRRELRSKKIQRSFLGALCALCGEMPGWFQTTVRPLRSAAAVAWNAACAWVRACAREASGCVPADRRAHKNSRPCQMPL